MKVYLKRFITLIFLIQEITNFASHDSKILIEAASMYVKKSIEDSLIAPLKTKIPMHIMYALTIDDVTALRKYLNSDTSLLVKHGTSMLIFAALGQCVNCVNELISRRVDVNAKDIAGGSAMRAAAMLGNITILSNLIAAGASVKELDKLNNTLLHWAAYGKANISVAAFLIQRGVPIDAKNKNGEKAIDVAHMRNNLRLVDYLNKTSHHVIFLPAEIVEAVKWDDLAKVMSYLDSTGSVDAVTNDGFRMTLLMLAAQEGRLNIVKELIKRMANINAMDKRGWTALTYATVNEYPKVAQELKGAGAHTDTMVTLGAMFAEQDKKFYKEPLDSFANSGLEAPASAAFKSATPPSSAASSPASSPSASPSISPTSSLSVSPSTSPAASTSTSPATSARQEEEGFGSYNF